MVGKALVAILALFLLLAAFATDIQGGVKEWRTGGTTVEAFAVETAAGVTNANVTLAYELFQDATAEVTAFSSNDTGDTPVALAYTTATQVLQVGGLEANEVRTLGVTYYPESTNDTMRVAGPFLGILILGGCIGAIFWSMFHKKGR